MQRRSAISVLLLWAAFSLDLSKVLAADNADIVASQVRKQGFPCNSPVSAERNPQQSKPHGMVWMLRCQNTTYRVQLIPARPAQIEPAN